MSAAEDDDQTAAAFRAAHPFASEVEVAEAVAKARGGARVSVPLPDKAVGVSVAWPQLDTFRYILAGLPKGAPDEDWENEDGENE